MKKMKILAIMLCLLLFTVAFTGCFATQTSTTPPASASRITYAEEALPKNTPENQAYLEEYMYPFAVTGLFRRNFSPDDMSELLDAEYGPFLESVFNVLYFIHYPDDELNLTNIDIGVPEAILEDTIMAHFNLTREEIRESFIQLYSPESKVYNASFGLGGGPGEYVITGSSLENGVISLSYDFYGGDDQNPTDSFRWLLRARGELVIELDGDSFKFISNNTEKAPGIED